MFKQAFRLTFVVVIWKQYKRAIVSTALLFAYLWFVGFAHSEYLSFAELQPEETSIALSFFVKWFALILGVALYMGFHFFTKTPNKKSKGNERAKLNAPSTDEPDPFEQIRHKEKLRSRAEIIIDKNKG